MDPQKITELANLLRKNGDKILSSEFTLTLSGPLLRALNDSFTLIADSDIVAGGGLGTLQKEQQAFQVVKPINAKSSVFADLQLLHDFVQKTTLLKLNYFPSEHYFEGAIDICKFRALRRLEVHKINICQVVGIQALRAQLQQIICIKSLNNVDDIITHCGGDMSNGFVWNELQSADFSYNNLRSVDTALEFAQHLQHLNLRHNKLTSVRAIKWLPHLKTLDVSYNCLTHLPQFHVEACKRLQMLNISNNYVEELLDMTKLDALTNMDLSDNCLLEHTQLLPLSVLMTLTVLNLQGNPLACHPKHRLATAQYLHKNTATVKFVLDFEPLSKAEKALAGSQQMRFAGSMNHRLVSSHVSINSSRASVNTPASSVGSQRSFSLKGKDSSSEAEQTTVDMQIGKRRLKTKKPRTVEIAEHGDEVATEAVTTTASVEAADLTPEKPQETTDGSHLETKKQIETLRLKYGNEWLQSGNAEQMLGLDTPQPSEEDRHVARQQFNEFLGEFSPSAQESEPTFNSTPANSSNWSDTFSTTLTPIKKEASNDTDSNKTQQTIYESCNNSVQTEYESMNRTMSQEQLTEPEAEMEQEIDIHKAVLKCYSDATAEEEEEPVSEEEPDEKVYIVYHENKATDPLFLTISSNYVREKDALTERTKTKWSIKVLESCERIKSNTLRINFDTMQKDKQERVYCVENALCQELEKKLRDILSQRDLTEMNITIYSCVNCGIRFTRERKNKNYKTAELRCPDCRSLFVAEVTDECGSLDKPKVATVEPKLSPALIVEESPVNTPPTVQAKEDDQSIGSANSLNESSSCSKITNSQCSFDSNQSVVGSSNTDRDLEFRANESDVDIISNPSQSSIEVLDPSCAQSASRKTSEERRISQMPNLQTIDDDLSQSQNFIEREQTRLIFETDTAAATTTMDTTAKSKALAHVQLTESSSSGSVTDSICTTYEQQAKQQTPDKAQKQPTEDVNILQNLLMAESGGSSSHIHNNNNNNYKEVAAANGHHESKHIKTAEDPLLSHMFGALFQSTTKLMSSSKKLIETEATASSMQPYKFNYSDYSDIDHRLKLYFYQSKFKEVGEHFKWLAKGRIYNEQTQTMRDGILVISTSKCYLMEAYADPQDDVAKWLRQVICVTTNRMTRIRLLPWKLGLSFTLRDWGGFVLILQDTMRTDNLLFYLAENPLPKECEVIQHPSNEVIQRLSSLVAEPIKICAILSGCQWTSGQEEGHFELCTLITTDSQLHIAGNGKFNWMASNEERQPPIELSLTQQMSNLVEVDRLTDIEYNVNFLDETENKSEVWHLQFETLSNAELCLNAIGKSWEELFGVQFSYSGT
ncbi:serine/threonine-protein kinase 11-interacting protein isoform X2 [Drosophila hydei]|uniref:Serine/threonine-protein kinase 11-interacting protein isoform X2 n=1 Tax=Drosophila hydei TaxID=7224 RepID=A0A6J1M739_DROHY|nr:serine/threonine-protein kinase 11-interacting protein isoform X2 [Drosophila hydei]